MGGQGILLKLTLVTIYIPPRCSKLRWERDESDVPFCCALYESAMLLIFDLYPQLLSPSGKGFIWRRSRGELLLLLYSLVR